MNNTQAKKCPHCVIVDNVPRCKKCGNVKCTPSNCPYTHEDNTRLNEYEAY